MSEGSSRGQNLILLVIIIGTLMSAIDTTIVLLAIPTITNDLHTNLATSIWIIMAYLFVVAIFTTQLGKLGDLFGRGKLFNIGFTVFTIGSALCGASVDALMLIAFRCVQALGGALMQANSGAIIADVFPPERRGRAFGYTAIGWSLGAMLGIVLGGVITTLIGWRYIFYINIPIGIIAVYFGMKYLKDEKTTSTKLDLVGMVLLAVSLLLISLGAIGVATAGASTANIVMFVVGAILMPIFIYRESKSSNPTIDIKILKNRMLAASISASFFQSLGFFAVVFLVIIYLQGVRGLTPLNASLLLVPGYLVSGITAPFMGRLSDKFGARHIATIGLLMNLLAVGVYMLIGASTPLYYVVVGSILSGFGLAMFFPANSSAVMSNAPQGAYGATSGLLRTLGNIGTLGSYVISIILISAAIPKNLVFAVFLGTSNLSSSISAQFVSGLHAAFLGSALIIAIATVLSFMRGNDSKKEQWQQK